jgi:site-specific recombinase
MLPKAYDSKNLNFVIIFNNLLMKWLQLATKEFSMTMPHIAATVHSDCQDLKDTNIWLEILCFT